MKPPVDVSARAAAASGAGSGVPEDKGGAEPASREPAGADIVRAAGETGPAPSPLPHAAAHSASDAASLASPSLPDPARGAIPIVQHVPIGAVPVEIVARSLAGVNRLEIRLEPEDLGRVEVRLEIGQDGAVQARLVVDRIETLALLQRDAKTLESAFEQAGLKPSEGGIDFTLRDPHADARGQHRGDERGQRAEQQRADRAATEADEAEVRPDKIIRTIWRASGVDRRI
ncbi:MAG TPA: flagellar hook-length control protein FliK [Beijerinckiaceae bacterium]|nr:flagellar hook-length control protein FliK [Beijerinckiaceae bacterium]